MTHNSVDSRPCWQRPKGERPRVLAHRGARLVAPENTMLAFRRALELGADGVELDVRLTGDRQVVVIHDADLARVSSGRAHEPVSERALTELRAVDLGQGQVIPTLAEVLDWAAEVDCLLNVELKPDPLSAAVLVSEVAHCIERSTLSKRQLLVSCFASEVLELLGNALPELALAWLLGADTDLEQARPILAALKPQAIHPQHRLLNRQSVGELKRLAPWLNAWTVNQAVRAQELATLGVDSIITDAPDHVLSALSPQE